MSTSQFVFALLAQSAVVIGAALFVGGKLEVLATIAREWDEFRKEKIPTRVAVIESAMKGGGE